MGLARQLLNDHKTQITSLEILPSGGGVFEVTLDGKTIFSKKATDRFPEDEEINALLKQSGGAAA